MTPKLPEPIARVTTKLGTHCSFNAPEIVKGDAIYTADQMHEMWKQGIEDAAKVCDDLAARDELSNYYKVAARAIRKEITP